MLPESNIVSTVTHLESAHNRIALAFAKEDDALLARMNHGARDQCHPTGADVRCTQRVDATILDVISKPGDLDRGLPLPARVNALVVGVAGIRFV